MLLYKFDTDEDALCYEEWIRLRCREDYKNKYLFKTITNGNVLFIEGDSELAEVEFKEQFSLLTDRLIPPKNINFELIKLRYRMNYYKCIPLCKFQSSKEKIDMNSEKNLEKIKICELISSLENGNNFSVFIGKKAEEFVYSLLMHQFIIKNSQFVSNLETVKSLYWHISHATNNKKISIVLSSSRETSFLTKSLLQDLYQVNPNINILATVTDLDECSLKIPDYYEKVFVERIKK